MFRFFSIVAYIALTVAMAAFMGKALDHSFAVQDAKLASFLEDTQ